MTHRQKLEALIGLLLGMFVAFLSSTIVSNALPVIITDLPGTQGQYTWVVTATLLASTATTPLWGKLSDLISKKILVQASLTLFTLGSVLAGLSQSVGMLIGFRVIQGLGLGGLQALVVIVIASMFSPRERGRYQGPIAAVVPVGSAPSSVRTPRTTIITTDGTTTTETVNGLQDFQKHVEGWVELLYTDDERHIFWFNEEGKVNGMAANDKAHRLVHELVTGLSPWDVIVGPVLITGPLAADGEHYEAPAAEMLARFDLA